MNLQVRLELLRIENILVNSELKINGTTIPINKTEFGEVEGLPLPQPYTYYVVSMLVAQAMKDRQDILIVDNTVRDEKGRITGAIAFARL